MIELRVQIHGPSGSGKTHLATAIAELVKSNNWNDGDEVLPVNAVILDDPHGQGQAGAITFTTGSAEPADTDEG